jgi:hypothetical protein
MGKTYVLDRVAADLARGTTHPAIQRLSSLVAAYPTDLDLRRRLAAVHRRVGNRIQAGRWDYLTIGADTRDTSAFERAFPSATARLRAVRWPYRAGQAATAYARARLEKLMAAAAAERSTAHQAGTGTASGAAPGMESRPAGSRPAGSRWRRAVARARTLGRRRRVPPVAVAVAAPVAAFFVVLGAATVIGWLIH